MPVTRFVAGANVSVSETRTPREDQHDDATREQPSFAVGGRLHLQKPDVPCRLGLRHLSGLRPSMGWPTPVRQTICSPFVELGLAQRTWETGPVKRFLKRRQGEIDVMRDNGRRKTVKDYIRTIVDFPHEGIMFRDVTTLFADARGFRMCIDQLLHPYAGEEIDKVVGLEARGFIIGGAIAHQLSVGFVPIRKKGKLPGATISEDYQLEYGEAVMEIHDDAIQPGEKVLVVDDLLATGGTAGAGIKLLERLGAEIVGCAFIVDLPELGGRKLVESLGMDVHVLCEFEGA